MCVRVCLLLLQLLGAYCNVVFFVVLVMPLSFDSALYDNTERRKNTKQPGFLISTDVLKHTHLSRTRHHIYIHIYIYIMYIVYDYPPPIN